MTQTFQLLKKKLNVPARTLFLIDGIGALSSALLLGFVLVEYEVFFGMPPKTLYFLAFWPCLFALYDVFNVLNSSPDSSFLIRVIAIANVGYCLLSLGALISHFDSLTTWGVAYFVTELIIIVVLVIIEFITASQQPEPKF